MDMQGEGFRDGQKGMGVTETLIDEARHRGEAWEENEARRKIKAGRDSRELTKAGKYYEVEFYESLEIRSIAH